MHRQFQLFVGSLPAKSMCVGKAGRKDRCLNQGLYYVQCPKRGLVASGGECFAIPGLLGSGEWVVNLLQQRTLAFACARVELIQVGKILLWLLSQLREMGTRSGNALVQGYVGKLSSKLSFLQDRYGKSSRFTHGRHNTNTICFGIVSWRWNSREVRGKLS